MVLRQKRIVPELTRAGRDLMGRKSAILAICSGDSGRRASDSKRKSCKIGVVFLMLLPGACNPTVRLDTAVKPIVISLYVKIDQEVRVRVDRDLDDAELNNLLALSTGSTITTGGAQTTAPAAGSKQAPKKESAP